MLVLTRRLGETIVIDGGIHITVVAVKGDRVRIGITAPLDVQVDRQEVHHRRSEFKEFNQPEQLSASVAPRTTRSKKRGIPNLQQSRVQP